MKPATNAVTNDELGRFIHSLERAGLKPRIVSALPPPVSILDHDTSPGAGGIFSPPALWKGSKKDYLAFMRVRYTDVGFRRSMLQCARCQLFGGRIVFRGPWANEARSILDKLVTHVMTQTGTDTNSQVAQ